MGGFNYLFAVIMMLSSQALGSNQTDVHFWVGNASVVSVSDTGFSVGWYSADPTIRFDHGRAYPRPASTVLRYGDSPDPATWTTSEVPGETAYHHVEVTGLEPGKRYFFEASSNGVRATNIWPGMRIASPGWVVTLDRPGGERLARLAISNDWHFGEERSGILSGNFPPFFSVDPENPYWRFMAEAVVADAEAHDADVLVIAGDLTNEAEPFALEEVAAVAGSFDGAVLVGRGNHDRAHAGDIYDTCSPVPDMALFDCFADYFSDAGPGEADNSAIDAGPLRLVMLDSVDVANGNGVVTESTATFLAAELAADGDRPVIAFEHHPASWASISSWIPWPGFMLERSSVALLNAASADAGNLLGFFAGHTHRSQRNHGANPDAIYQETGSVKEHIGGYALVDVYSEGLVHSYRRAACSDCLEWSQRTAQEYFGLYPWIVDGKLSDRAYSTRFARPIGHDGSLGDRSGDLVVYPALSSAQR